MNATDISPDAPTDALPGSGPDEALRADIRLVTTILGDTLVRTEGPELLELVELVRAHSRQESLDDLPDLDLATTTKLGAHDRAQLVVAAYETGLVTPPRG